MHDLLNPEDVPQCHHLQREVLVQRSPLWVHYQKMTVQSCLQMSKARRKLSK